MRNLLIFTMIISSAALYSCKNGSGASGQNPFMTEWETQFGMPPFGEILPEHYQPAYEEAIKEHNAEIAAIVENVATPDFNNVILALDDAGQMLSRVSSTFGIVNSADTNDELLEVNRTMSPILTAHSDEIIMNSALFAKVKAVYDNRASLGLDSLQMRLLDKTYKRFVRAGANLSDDQKTELKEINKELAMARIKFGSNLLDANNNFKMVLESEEELAGLPASVKEAAAIAATDADMKGKYLFNLDKPSMLPFLTYSTRRDLRERLYRGYLDRCNGGDSIDNKQVINDIVKLNDRKVKLLGYADYPEFVLEERMAGNAANVNELLDYLWTPALDLAKKELEEMRAIKVEETGNPDFESWDWWFYAEKVRKSKYDLDEEMLRPYFSLESVRGGIFDLCNRLYGLTFRPVALPVYNDECQTYEVLDADNSHLGVLIMDFFPRPGKRVGAWCGSLKERTYKDGQKTDDPITYITCNFTRPAGAGKPALLSLDEVETFFHEFGHALHNLFDEVPYNGLKNTERDFVELPSQIMENWAFEPRMLARYAVHYLTGNVIPDHLVKKIQNSSLFNMGFVTTELLAAAISDMEIYSAPTDAPIDVNAFEQQVLNTKRGLIPQIAPRYRYPYFNHIFTSGYAVGYYSYIWAEVLDKDAFQAFAETGDIFNRNVAASFRTNILSKGGSSDGMTLYRNFRGADPNRDYLLYGRGLKERPAILPDSTNVSVLPDTPVEVDAIDE